MGDHTNYLVIGISGTTNSGKTSLVTKLKDLFPQAETMCQDKYFLEPDDERLQPYFVEEVNHVNWEQFGALDMACMLEDVEKWRCQASSQNADVMPILIIEGFLIFNHRHRIYNPPDKPGYFEKVVWPMYLKNRKEMEAQTDIVYLDGTEDQDRIVQSMAADIQQLLAAHRLQA